MSISEKNTLNKASEIAISVQGVSKTFKIPHEKISSLRGIIGRDNVYLN